MGNFNLDDYITVNERIAEFYNKHPEGRILTDIVFNENGQIIFKAYAYKDNSDSITATGHAMEKEGSTFINKTSHIENCETSAVGRALAIMGFGISKAICSREEVENAILNQGDKKVSKQETKPENKQSENKTPSINEKRATAIWKYWTKDKGLSDLEYKQMLKDEKEEGHITDTYGKKWNEDDLNWLENRMIENKQEELPF